MRSRVDRWFDRSRYAADGVRAEFAASLRNLLDLGAITTALVETSAHTGGRAMPRWWLAPHRGIRAGRVGPGGLA